MQLNAIIETDLATGLLVGSVPDIPGAHSQGDTVDEVRANLVEVLELLQLQTVLPSGAYITTVIGS